MNESGNTAIFPIGNRFDNENFSGEVWLKMLVPYGTSSNCPIANVTFAPGCRNSWHMHPGGQILLVTAWHGYYQEWGKTARELRLGDVVEIPANIKHWNGAAKDCTFTHIAIETNTQTGSVKWMEPVSDSYYNNLQNTL